MADQREEEMLELMREATRCLRRCENSINEIWAEWTRTHGLKGIRGPQEAPDGTTPPRRRVVRHG